MRQNDTHSDWVQRESGLQQRGLVRSGTVLSWVLLQPPPPPAVAGVAGVFGLCQRKRNIFSDVDEALVRPRVGAVG